MHVRLRTLPSATSRLVIAAALMLGAAVAVRAQPPNQKGAAGAQDDATFLRQGQEVTERICSDCHDLDDVYKKRKTQREWDETVADMAVRGADATPGQFALVKRYLTRTWGSLPINTATPEEMTAVLGLTGKEAAAIVAYRKAHGPFADRAALSKVEGVDQAKIDAQPDALVFTK
jgi:competence ComEA-like helix-hairpin-helix protein